MATDPELKITTQRLGDIDVLAVIGEIDLATASSFGLAIESVSDGRRRVVLDLNDVEFFDSSGVAALVHGHRELAQRGIELWAVVPTTGIVRQVLQLTQTDQLITIVDDLNSALA